MRCSSTRPSASAATPRRCSPAASWPASSASTATRPRSTSAAPRLAPFGDRVHRRARGLRRDPRRARRPRARRGRRRAVRPRRLVDAARPAASAASPTPRTRRSTCGWTPRPDRPPPTCSTPTRRAELTRVLRDYGEERFARRIADAIVRQREQRAVHHLGPPGRAAVRRDPGAGAPYRRPPGQAHLPGAADGGQRRARRAAPRDPGRHRRDRRGRPGRRGVLPLARGPAGQAGLRRRDPVDVPEDLPFVPEGSEPALRLVTRGAEQADDAEIAANPRAASVRLRAVERISPAPAEEQHEHDRRRCHRARAAPARSPRPPSSGPA